MKHIPQHNPAPGDTPWSIVVGQYGLDVDEQNHFERFCLERFVDPAHATYEALDAMCEEWQER